MALQLYADGTYNLVYEVGKTVELRDWFATLTNTLSEQAVLYLQEKKAEEKRRAQERIEQARRAAFPEMHSNAIDKESERIAAPIAMMGLSAVPTAQVLDRPRTLPPKVALGTFPIAKRVVKTSGGLIEVAADVSDDELTKLGFIIEASPEAPNVQPHLPEVIESVSTPAPVVPEPDTTSEVLETASAESDS